MERQEERNKSIQKRREQNKSWNEESSWST